MNNEKQWKVAVEYPDGDKEEYNFYELQSAIETVIMCQDTSEMAVITLERI